MVSPQSATELIELKHFSLNGDDYIPTWISTSKREVSKTIGYYQIGRTSQHGLTYSPVYKMIFDDINNVAATHIKIWGISNDVDAAIFSVDYLKGKTLEVFLNKFEFTDDQGDIVDPMEPYTIIGCKKNSMPITY